ncbi:MAG: S8 family serine peptidase [Planctomycetota bacterium]|jgi:subtilisin family serine protease
MKFHALCTLAIVLTVFSVNLAGADLEVSPVDDFNTAGEPGGPFTPPLKDYQLKNVGPVSLMWGGDKTTTWLTVNPEWGMLGPNESVVVTVTITSEANSLPEGIHADTLTFTDLTNGLEYTRGVTLRVAYPGSIWFEPNSFDVNVIEGCRLAEAMTIGNTRPVDVNFVIRSRVTQVSAQSALAPEELSMSEQDTIPSSPRDPDFSIPANAVYRPGRLIVRFAPSAKGKQRSTAEKNQVLSSLGGAIVKRNYKLVPGLSVVELPAPMAVENAVRAFNKANGILYAQPDYQVQALSTIPNDTRFAELWGLHNTGQNSGTPDADIDAPEAWDIATGSRQVVVAVLDTGVDYTHVDLAPNMWINELEFYGETGFDDDGNEYVDDIYGYDFCNYDSDPMDDHTFIYHGTHCAGTIGAAGNNAQGVAGVCWNVRIMALKFLDSFGYGWESDAIAAIDYSIVMRAHLSSNSWGGKFYNQGLKDAIDAAGAAGMLFVAAAGNDNANTDEQAHYPSNYNSPCIISVMATDRNDDKSGFSNYGPTTVDLGAPGSEILSCKRGDAYQYLGGTSMATPHAAGACALLWSVNPALTPAEVKDILLQTVDPTLAGMCVSGGRLNLYNAILQARAPWIDIEPEQGTIPAGDSNQIDVDFHAVRMAPGIHQGEIIILSTDPFNPTNIVPVNMTVVPDDVAVTPDEDFWVNGIMGGPFRPASLTYTLTNIADTSVSWTTFETPDWLIVEPNGGVLDPCQAIDVNVCMSPDADLLEPNLYSHLLTFKNTDSNSIKPRLVTLAVRPPDSFAESFDEADNDLSFRSLTFRPDGSVAYYEACRGKITQFPTDPNGGTYVPLWDDDFVEVTLTDGAQVLFYGQRYDRFYIGSNGYITFGQGDMEYDAALEYHFGLPRISGLFADLDPPDDECISYKQLEDRVAVTFENVPLYPYKPGTAMNSLQIEMSFVDGAIRINWLELAAGACVAGLSKGEGRPAVLFTESNLSEYPPCRPLCDFDADYSVGFRDFAVLADYWQYGDCNIPYWCGRSDVDFSGSTDANDLAVFAASWLTVEDWWLPPIAHWKFDEGQGDIAYDCVGASHGTLMGDPNWVAGLIDGALSLDGAEDYVKVPDSRHVNFGPGTSFTLSVWVSYTTSDPVRIEQKYDPDSENGYSILGSTEDMPAGTISFRTWSAGKAKKVYYRGGYNDGEWHLVVAVRDQLTDRMYLYVDGVKRHEAAENKRDLKNTGNLHIGTGWNADGYFFEGSLDDARIYDRALSTEEIGQLYQEPTE